MVKALTSKLKTPNAIVGSNPTSAFFFLLFFGIDKINFLLKGINGVGDG